MESASKAGGRLKSKKAHQGVERTHRTEGASDVEGRLRGWMTPQKLQGVSETGGHLRF